MATTKKESEQNIDQKINSTKISNETGNEIFQRGANVNSLTFRT